VNQALALFLFGFPSLVGHQPQNFLLGHILSLARGHELIS
jgi:hypothetical protein